MSAHDLADVAIVGAGPAGLAAAVALREAGAGRVVVLEREAQPGGIPRHAHHQGYGLRDLRRPLTGPAYAARRAELAVAAGVEIVTATQATGWAAPGELQLTGRAGRRTLGARAVVLATGCRERPRAARLVPGARPQGVMTTGTLQQLVYLAGERPGRRAVVVGAEHVAFSALLTLRHGGAEPVLMTTERAAHESFAAFRAGAVLRFRVPLRTRTALTRIDGRRRVEAVELTNVDTGATELVPCDTVIFTANWIPDHELAVLAGARLDAGTGGPEVTPGLHTTVPGLFATGNLLHGAETADVAALEGAHVAAAVTQHLSGSPWPTPVPITVTEPLRWVTPNAITPGAPARDRFLVRAIDEYRHARLRITQDGRTLHEQRLRHLSPGISASLSAAWTPGVDPTGGPVTVQVTRARRPT